MKNILRKIFYRLCIFLDREDSCARILMYHSFRLPNIFFNVQEEEFKRQLEYLKKNNYTILTLAELAARVISGATLRRVVVLTFDDAHSDFPLAVLPVLGTVPTTVFWPTGITMLRASSGEQCPLMPREDIVKLPETVDIGSHAVTHRELTTLTIGEVAGELKASYDTVSSITEKPVAFSYPRGKYTHMIRDMVQDTGYFCACTVRPGAVSHKSNTYELPRISIDSATDMLAFRAKLSWLYATIYSLW